ncbi:MAG: trimeric intracellular cation channel family protein [Spirosomaceae bacterium]|nr:trimeric intracellular cation channel family protein [Spirosomataceae bacterium]
MTWIYIFDILGTLVFAISGVLTAMEKKFDVVGTIIIGMVTAIGGGTLRDILIGQTPVAWMLNDEYLIVILLGVFLAHIFKSRIQKLRKSMFLFDTIGIGLFTILGLQKTLDVGLSVPISVLMGIVSASFGGVIRDVLTNEIPLIFRKEIYATACFAGAIIFLILSNFSSYETANMLFSMFAVFIIRYFAVKNGWSLRFYD